MSIWTCAHCGSSLPTARNEHVVVVRDGAESGLCNATCLSDWLWAQHDLSTGKDQPKKGQNE